MTITKRLHKIEGQGWTKVFYDIQRNGETLFTAFRKENGTGFSCEHDDRFVGEFKTMKEVMAFAARRPVSLNERLAQAGILEVSLSEANPGENS
jgi:hypothetical protein